MTLEYRDIVNDGRMVTDLAEPFTDLAALPVELVMWPTERDRREVLARGCDPSPAAGRPRRLAACRHRRRRGLDTPPGSGQRRSGTSDTTASV